MDHRRYIDSPTGTDSAPRIVGIFLAAIVVIAILTLIWPAHSAGNRDLAAVPLGSSAR
jgi:hypothetical protein